MKTTTMHEFHNPDNLKPEPAPLDNDRWESLLHKNSTLEKRVKELEEKCSKINEVKARANALIATHEKLQSKLTAAQARLDQLEWRPVSVKPTKEDANKFDYLEATDGEHIYHFKYTNFPIRPSWTHWRPFAPPTIPDQSRVEFENWWKSNGVSGFPEATAFDLWKAARGLE